jgi:hypothetical protein
MTVQWHEERLLCTTKNAIWELLYWHVLTHRSWLPYMYLTHSLRTNNRCEETTNKNRLASEEAIFLVPLGSRSSLAYQSFHKRRGIDDAKNTTWWAKKQQGWYALSIFTFALLKKKNQLHRTRIASFAIASHFLHLHCIFFAFASQFKHLHSNFHICIQFCAFASHFSHLHRIVIAFFALAS